MCWILPLILVNVYTDVHFSIVVYFKHTMYLIKRAKFSFYLKTIMQRKIELLFYNENLVHNTHRCQFIEKTINATSYLLITVEKYTIMSVIQFTSVWRWLICLSRLLGCKNLTANHWINFNFKEKIRMHVSVKNDLYF